MDPAPPPETLSDDRGKLRWLVATPGPLAWAQVKQVKQVKQLKQLNTRRGGGLPARARTPTQPG